MSQAYPSSKVVISNLSVKVFTHVSNYYYEYLTRYYFANGSLCTSIVKIRSTNNGPLKFSC